MRLSSMLLYDTEGVVWAQIEIRPSGLVNILPECRLVIFVDSGAKISIVTTPERAAFLVKFSNLPIVQIDLLTDKQVGATLKCKEALSLLKAQ
jgi:hypothetical protein